MAKLFMTLIKSGQMFFRYLFAVVAGWLTALSFAPNRWFLSIIGLAILIRILDRSGRVVRIKVSLLFSMTYFLIHLTWLQVVGYDGWILLSLISSLPWLLIAIVSLDVHKVSSIAHFAAIVVVVEVVRSHIPYGGFPWGLVAFSQLDGPFISFARIGGQALVTFVITVIAGLSLRALSGRFISSVVIIFAIIFASHIPSQISTTEQIKVVAVQGNVPRLGLDQSAQRLQVFKNHVSQTEKYLNQVESNESKLIIWPESSTDIDPLQSKQVGMQIQTLVDRAQIPILVGATIIGSNPDGPRGSGILWHPDGSKDFYIKNHLVPFGEYLPHRNLLANLIGRFDLIPHDYIPGTEVGIFEIGNIKFGDVICYEVAFGETVRALIQGGAQFIVIQTNNATYGHTEQPNQQFAISRFRAIEHGRSVVIASTSGISGAISPDGQVLSKTNEFEPAIVEASIPVSTELTINDRFPRWVAILCLILTSITFTRTLFRRKIS